MANREGIDQEQLIRDLEIIVKNFENVYKTFKKEWDTIVQKLDSEISGTDEGLTLNIQEEYKLSLQNLEKTLKDILKDFATNKFYY